MIRRCINGCGHFISKQSLNLLCEKCETKRWEAFVELVETEKAKEAVRA